MDPDEGRYAEIAREMLVSGNYLTPHLNFLPYLEKPPLVYWLTALALHLGGFNEWAARLIPALSALGGVLAVYWLASHLWGPGTALLAGLVTATSSGYFVLARLLLLDMTLTCFMTWGLALAYVAVRKQRRLYLPWAYLAFGLAVLAKGPVGLVLPALIFLTWLGLQRRWRDFLSLWHTGGALILAAIVLPWYILVAWHNPDFFHYFFFQEHIQRFLAPKVHAGQPFYFYLGVLAAGFLPWAFFLPWAWVASKPKSTDLEAYRDRRFLLVWFGVIFLFFSLARAKLFPYLLPGLPPLAMLVARALANLVEQKDSSSPGWRWTMWVWLGLALLIFLSLMILAAFFPMIWERLAFISPYPVVIVLTLAIPPILLLAGLVPPARCHYLLVGSAITLNLLLVFTIERVAEIKSPKPLAQLINSHRQADDIIVGFQLYSQSISFYTAQPWYLFQTKGELEFGMQQQPGNPYYKHWPTELVKLLHTHQDFFVIINQDNLKTFQSIYPEPITALGQWKNYLVIRRP
jgi:4-amino-4-deoxy-L-arabinose transferase-like glycosyltransferase